MTTSNLNLFYYAKLTLKEKANPTNTKVVNLSNRPLPDEAATTTYYPILLRCNGMGSSAGETTPDSRSGGIEIDNSNGSFGYERRFSDLFDIYAIIGATIEVYSANVDLADINRDADFSLEWKSEIVGASDRVDTLPQTLRLNVAEEGIPRRVITRMIEPAGFPTAPSKSIGQHLPVIFSYTGETVPVKAYQISADAALDPLFAYATTFGSTHVSGGVSIYFVKTASGKFEFITNATATNIAVVDTNGGAETNIANQSMEQAVLLPSSGLARILVQGEMKFSPRNDIAWVANPGTKVFIKMYEAIENSASVLSPGKLVGQASVLKSDYQAAMRAAVNFDISFSFESPVIREADKDYFISVSQSYDDTAGIGGPNGDVFEPIVQSGVVDDAWTKYLGGVYAGGNVEAWTQENIVDRKLTYRLYAGLFTDNPNCVSSTLINSDGLGYAYFQISQKSAGAGQPYPDFTKLEFLVWARGLKDDTSGTITGTPSGNLNSAVHALKVLERSWNGSTWTGSLFDWTRFTNNHSAVLGISGLQKAFGRWLGGATQGRTTLDQVMSDICLNSACKIVRTRGSSNQLALWAWGYTQPITTVLSDEDTRLLSVDYSGYESIVNRALIAYKYDPSNADLIGLIEQGQKSNYTEVVDFSSSTSDYIRYFTSTSETLFSRREVKNSELNFIQSGPGDNDYTGAADSIALYYLAAFRSPSVYATIEVPFFKYRTLDLMDVIEIKHPGLPNYYGSSSAARLPYYSGSSVDVLDGQYYKRCKRYRAIIEGMETNFSGTQYPVKRLVLRLLTNFPHDPT